MDLVGNATIVTKPKEKHMTHPTTGETQSGSKKTEEVRQRVRAVRDDVRELGRAAKGAAGETYEDVKRQAGEFVDRKKQRVGEFEDQVVEYVRQKPLQSVLIAAGAGALIGFLLSRR